MSALSDYLEQKFLDHLLNGVTFTPPAELHLALLTTVVADDGTGGVEVSGGAYARQRVFKQSVTNTPGWNSAAVDGIGYVVDNEQEISFPQATANWGNVKGFGLYDHASTGNLLYHGPLAATQTVNANSTFKFAAGALDLRAE